MKIFMAITSYDRKMDVGFVVSMLNTIRMLNEKNIEHYENFHCCNVNISDARCSCVMDFLKSDCTHLMFFDSDLMFDPEGIIKLIKADKEIICGLYPYKDREGFPAELVMGECDPLIEDGLYLAKKIPTGFLMIKRNVLVDMLKKHNEYVDKKGIFRIFESGRVIPDNNEWYSEDIAFCLRASADGYKLYIEPDITFEHMRISGEIGNLKQYLGAKKE